MNYINSNTAEQLFWDGCVAIITSNYPAADDIEKICTAAELWRNNKNHLYAGLATSTAIISSYKFGLLFHNKLAEWSAKAINDYLKCIDNSCDDIVKILALMKIHQELIRQTTILFNDSLQVNRLNYSILANLAEEQISNLSTHENAVKILLEGFRIEIKFNGKYHLTTTSNIQSYNHYDSNTKTISYLIDPAFDILISIGDYFQANHICNTFHKSINTNRLKGWQCAVKAFITPNDAPKLFMDAANWLKNDTPDSTHMMKGMGEFANQITWSPHFYMRSLIAKATADQDNFEKYFFDAASLASEFKSISIPSVKRIEFLVKTLAGLICNKKGIDPLIAREQFLQIFHNEDLYDSIFLEFIDNAISGLSELQLNRRNGLSKIGRAMSALDRIPLLGESDTNTFTSVLDRQAIEAIEGKVYNWIHKSISEIESEDKLRKILLRLFQNQIPNYAQIRHGPLEYGKDIAVSIIEDGKNILRMYQVKCGNINKSAWNRECRPQLEEIFQVPMSEDQIPGSVDKHIGILIWNGHINTFVEDIISAWQREQREVFGRDYEFMNLDSIVNYIIDMRLVNALRFALGEIDNE